MAVPGSDRVVFLPIDTLALDGTNSTDDKEIVQYSWSQVRYVIYFERKVETQSSKKPALLLIITIILLSFIHNLLTLLVDKIYFF